tara:strand:- start:5848 stop:6795 length:948 start_codon:yes stop_codon:yes gene_type:complete
MKYVLGYNTVSYFMAYVLDIPLIKHKTLEELDRNHGADLIPSNLLQFTSNIFKDCKIEEYERFYNDRGRFTSKQPKNFHNLYSLYTRGKTNVEKSYLNQLEKYQKYVSINGLNAEDSFNALLEKIKESVNKTIIDNQLTGIDIQEKELIGQPDIKFTNLVSTINLVDLSELDKSGAIRKSIVKNYNLEGFNLPHNDKFIYCCKLESTEDKTLAGIYKQVLATGQPYYRKTYNKDSILYECMRNIYNKQIEGNTILKYSETTQISDNLNIGRSLGIDLIGKFSQWKENTTLDTIYNQCMELKEFYTIGENNHKKVF